MSDPLLVSAASQSADMADVVRKRTETLIVELSDSGRSEVSEERAAGVHLRIRVNGRVGMAGATTERVDTLVAAAIASASVGDPYEFHLPAPSSLPSVVTSDPDAATLGPERLADLARDLLEGVRGDRGVAAVWAERCTGRVEIVNSRGLQAGYDTTLVGLGVELRDARIPELVWARVTEAGRRVPDAAGIAELVAEVRPLSMSRQVQLDLSPPAGSRVCFLPRAVGALLRPIQRALQGQALLFGKSIWSGRMGDSVVDPRLSLIDDPLVDGRPGTRPIDDDGVAAHRRVLIDHGRLHGYLTDLMTGARARVPSTGHSVRTPFGPPRVGYSNLRLDASVTDSRAPASALGDGVLVRDIVWPDTGHPMSGVFRAVTADSYLVRGGEIAGRADRLVIAGNIYDLLQRVAEIGAPTRWVGARRMPWMVLEGVDVRRAS